MSNQSRMSPDTIPYRKYFGGIIQKMGVSPTINEYSPHLYLDANVPFQGHVPFQGQVGHARVRIALALSTNQSCWVVKEFDVSTVNHSFGVLSGSDFLEHYGKRLGKKEGDLSKPGNQLWTMTCAANLQAMLEAYDRLAKELGKSAIFGH